MTTEKSQIMTGGCLCGGVRYEIDGDCRDIIYCHCENCRRTHGHVAAYTALPQSRLTLVTADTLQWFHDSSPDTYRGFCNHCGASLFWDARDGSKRMSVSAGTLDDSGELKSAGHVFTSEAPGYYNIEDDLPRFEYSNAGALESEAEG